jgi:hypothetical protein
MSLKIENSRRVAESRPVCIWALRRQILICIIMNEKWRLIHHKLDNIYRHHLSSNTFNRCKAIVVM